MGTIFPRQPDLSKHSFHYEIIDFKPSEIDGLMVIEAIKNLKLPNGTKFFNLPQSYNPTEISPQDQGQTKQNEEKTIHKLFYLKNSTARSAASFYNFFYSLDTDEQYGIGPMTKSDKVNLKYKEYRAIWQKLNRKKEDVRNSEILRYKKLVLNDFTQSILWFAGQIRRYVGSNEYGKKLVVWNALRNLFPGYLLYVDIISAIVPVGEVDQESTFLRIHRKEAGDIFFQVLGRTFFGQNEGWKPVPRAEIIISELIQMFERDNFIEMIGRFSVVWKFLELWLLTARDDPFGKRKASLTGYYKHFYNSMVFDLLNQS